MQRVLKEAVYEDRTIRQEIRHVLDVFAGEIMQGYQDSRNYACPQSQGEDYLFGWYMAEKTEEINHKQNE